MLNNLPAKEAPPSLVYRIVINLTKLHPGLAYRYYRIGVSCLSDPRAAAKLGISVIKIVKKSGLTSKQLRRFISHVIKRPPCGCSVFQPIPLAEQDAAANP
jgi:hypothetical protein